MRKAACILIAVTAVLTLAFMIAPTAAVPATAAPLQGTETATVTGTGTATAAATTAATTAATATTVATAAATATTAATAAATTAATTAVTTVAPTADATAAPGTLPRTGGGATAPWLFLGIAIILLLGGGLVLGVSRRRG
jgi:LPXTG-motif cell wall-anchored protein